MTLRRHRKESGLTLIELMVAMVLALLVMAAVGAVYIIASRNLTQQDGEGRLQQSGAAALAIVTQQLLKAGVVDMPAEWQGWKDETPGQDRLAFLLANVSPALEPGTRPATVHGCDAGYKKATDLASTECNESGSTGTAAITLAWQVRRNGGDFALPPSTPGCLGATGEKALPSAQVNDLTYTDAAGLEQPVTTTWTICRISLDSAAAAIQFTQGGSSEATTAVVADNIADLRIRYLMGASGSDGSRLSGYSDTAVGLAWAEVTGVEVCLLMRVRAATSPPAGSTYMDCTGSEKPHAGASYLYRAVRSVVALRSRMPRNAATPM